MELWELLPDKGLQGFTPQEQQAHGHILKAHIFVSNAYDSIASKLDQTKNPWTKKALKTKLSGIQAYIARDETIQKIETKVQRCVHELATETNENAKSTSNLKKIEEGMEIWQGLIMNQWKIT